jgi:hypothetical protein
MPATLISPLRLHGNIDIASSSELDCARITSIGVAENAHTGIAGKNAL